MVAHASRTLRSREGRRFNVALFLTMSTVCALPACTRDLDLPPRPQDAPPGTISGRIVYAVPGKAQPVPAVGATVEVSQSSLKVTTNAEGLFLVDGITKPDGALYVRFDIEGDGRPDRQKVIPFADVGANRGRQIALGDVLIGRNAQLRGVVKRADIATRGGHAGTVVFVPEGPFSATTADDGTFRLDDLPEGPLVLGVFRAGYEPVLLDAIDLRSGEDFVIKELALRIDATPAQLANVDGTVTLSPAEAPISSVAVTLTGSLQRTVAPGADGRFRFDGVPVGPYTLSFRLEGFAPLDVPNVLVAENTSLANFEMNKMPPSAPPADAGLPSAPDASSLADASVQTDAGDLNPPPPDSGTGSDAGTKPNDAGTTVDNVAPTAVARPVVVGTGRIANLDGTGSFDPNGDFLVFHWTQKSGTPVTLSDNDTPSARAPAFTAPATTQTIAFELIVSDPFGAVSAPVTALVFVSAPPVALVTPSTATIRPTDPLYLDASMSQPAGPLTPRWTALSGAARITPLVGERLKFFFEPLTSGMITYELVVSDGTTDSAPVRLAITVDSETRVPALTAFINPPPTGTTVSVGQPLTLTTDVSSLYSTGNFRLEWRVANVNFGAPPQTGSMNNLPFSYTVAAPGQSQVTLNALNEFSGDIELYVELTFPGGPRPVTSVDRIHVSFEDTLEPLANVWEPVPNPTMQWNGSPLFAALNFNESVISADVVNGGMKVWTYSDGMLGVPVPGHVTYDADQNVYFYNYDAMLAPGDSYALVLDNIHDASNKHNVISHREIVFQARQLSTDQTVYVSYRSGQPPLGTASSFSAFPGIASVPFTRAVQTGPNPPAPETILAVVGRLGTGTTAVPTTLAVPRYFGSNGDVMSQEMLIGGAASIPSLSDVPAGRRALRVGGQTYGYVQKRTAAANPQSGVFLVRQGSSWSKVATPPGVIFSDGTSVHSAFVEGGVPKTATLNPAANSWTVGPPVETTQTWQDDIAGTAMYDFTGLVQRWVAVTTLTGLSVFRSASFGPWAQEGLGAAFAPVMAGDPGPIQPRLAAVAPGGVSLLVPVVLAIIPGASPQIRAAIPNGSFWTEYSNLFPAGPASSFDIISRGDEAFAVAAVGGALYMIRVHMTGPSALLWEPVNGPFGRPQVNDNLSCFADHPELAPSQDGIWLAWDEACNGENIVKVRRFR